MMYWILFIGVALGGWLVSNNLQRKFQRYSQMGFPLTGREVAEKMLHENGIRDVRVVSIDGMLTDHYDPTTKTVNLSAGVYGSNSIAAAAVAAHECGHAIQHACAYAPLQLRSALVPAVSIASKWVTWVILAGLLLIQVFPQLLWIGIILYAVTTLFSIVTLPVEINASSRALAWLKTTGLTNTQSQDAAFDALRAAAYTYVVAAIGSIATLIYYIMIADSRR
ncbi:MAG: zinc metallopeptidase [Paludibacteraceae bacterium]|nr:zinc metallopeptidase [Paludibacteraceae bacterium]